MMNKKQYITPTLEEYRIETHGMLAQSVFDPNSNSQTVIPSTEEHDGEFSAPELFF